MHFIQFNVEFFPQFFYCRTRDALQNTSKCIDTTERKKRKKKNQTTMNFQINRLNVHFEPLFLLIEASTKLALYSFPWNQLAWFYSSFIFPTHQLTLIHHNV